MPWTYFDPPDLLDVEVYFFKLCYNLNRRIQSTIYDVLLLFMFKFLVSLIVFVSTALRNG